MAKVLIYGNGPIARTAYHRFIHDSPHEVVGFTVDKAVMQEDALFDLPVVPFEEVEKQFAPGQHHVHIAVGYVQLNRLRADRYLAVKRMGYGVISDVSSRALVAETATIGENCIISANTIIGSDVRIGDNVFIGAGSFVGHDTRVGDHCFISDHVAIAGSAQIGAYSFLGINCTIRNKIAIARECVIGAGAVILQDTKPKEVYIAARAELLPISSDNLPVS